MSEQNSTHIEDENYTAEEETDIYPINNLSLLYSVNVECQEFPNIDDSDQSFITRSIINDDQKPHKCVTCDKTFLKKYHLKRHMATHTNKRPHQCNVCNKSFTRSEHLNSHLLIHTENNPNKCSFCEKLFSRKEHLKRHLIQIHDVGDKQKI